MKLKECIRALSALADETRLRILTLLCKGELCVCDIMRVLDEPQSKVSRHLGYLRRAGLVEARKEGLWMHYRLSKPSAGIVRAVFEALKKEPAEIEELKKDCCQYEEKKKAFVSCCG